MLATAWLDVVFTPLFLAHRETVQPLHAGYGGLIIHADYTHSIVGMLALSAALGAMFLPRLGRRVALVIALVSASHWVLDLVVHRPDMPVLPGNAGSLPYFGFGALESAASGGMCRAGSGRRRRDHVLARGDGGVG